MGFLKREISTSWGLIIIFGVAVLLFGGALTYYYRMAPTTYDYEIQNIGSAKLASVDATKDWKTYEDKTYGISFKYPKDWTDSPKVNNYEGSEAMIDRASREIVFKDFDKDKLSATVSFSNYDTYKTDFSDSITALQAIYTNKKVSSTDNKLSFPPLPIIAKSSAKYIETSDGKFRGLYYFANVGQDTSSNVYDIIILTDGQSKIVQIKAGRDTTVMQSEFACVKTGKCKDADSANIKKYTEALTDSSKEQIISELGIYKNIAKSVKSISVTDATANWQTYENDTYGISLKYPKDWKSEAVSSSPNILLLKSPETLAILDEIAKKGVAVGGPPSDVVVSYYKDLATADGNDPKKYQTLSDMVNDTSYFRSTKEIIFIGQKAYEGIEFGMTDSYTIILEKNNHIYKTGFNKESKDQITSIQQSILNSLTIE